MLLIDIGAQQFQSGHPRMNIMEHPYDQYHTFCIHRSDSLNTVAYIRNLFV